MYVDADEFFYCPPAGQSITSQRTYQQRLMSEFASLGVEEMRLVRVPYSGIAPPELWVNHSLTAAATAAAVGEEVSHLSQNNNNNNKKHKKGGEVDPAAAAAAAAVRAETDFTNNTLYCMLHAYEQSVYHLHHNAPSSSDGVLDLLPFFQCWSSATSFDNFPKSSDFAGKCPFHYNHWSCDGMRSGGRDSGPTMKRCRCKVGFEFTNFYEFKPHLERCHLLHFNDNKYRCG